MKGPFSAWSFLASTCGQIRFYSLMNCTYRGNSLASLIHSPLWNLQEQAARTSIWHWVREFHLPKPDLFANVSLEIGHQNWWIPSCVAGARVILNYVNLAKTMKKHTLCRPAFCSRTRRLCSVHNKCCSCPPILPIKGLGLCWRYKNLCSLISPGAPRAAEKMQEGLGLLDNFAWRSQSNLEERHVLATYGKDMNKQMFAP